MKIVKQKRTRRFRLTLTFFGLNDEYMEAVYEEIFLLNYNMNLSFTEIYNFPVLFRRWYIERLIKERQREAEQMKSTK